MDEPSQPLALQYQHAKPFKEKLSELVGELALEAIASFLVVFTIAVSRKLVEWYIGVEAKFFDRIPVGWAFDLSDMVLIASFVIRALQKIGKER